MPLPTRYQRMRWASYLRGLIEETPTLTRSQIARAGGVNVSRVNQWLKADRGIEPQTAFLFGEQFAATLRLETSGLEALYVCGFWTEFFSLLKHLSTDRANGGPALAVAVYCTLPAHFRDFDRATLVDALAHLSSTHPLEFQRVRNDHRRDIVQLGKDQAGGRYTDNQRSWQRRRLAYLRALRGPKTRAALNRAWQRVLSGGPVIFTFAKDENPKLYPGEDTLPLLDLIIELARTMASAIPTLTALRLWRISAEWASNVDASFYRRRDLIPDPQSTFDWVYERDSQDEAWAEDAAMQAAYDSWRGK